MSLINEILNHLSPIGGAGRIFKLTEQLQYFTAKNVRLADIIFQAQFYVPRHKIFVELLANIVHSLRDFKVTFVNVMRRHCREDFGYASSQFIQPTVALLIKPQEFFGLGDAQFACGNFVQTRDDAAPSDFRQRVIIQRTAANFLLVDVVGVSRATLEDLDLNCLVPPLRKNYGAPWLQVG